MHVPILARVLQPSRHAWYQIAACVHVTAPHYVIGVTAIKLWLMAFMFSTCRNQTCPPHTEDAKLHNPICNQFIKSEPLRHWRISYSSGAQIFSFTLIGADDVKGPSFPDASERVEDARILIAADGTLVHGTVPNLDEVFRSHLTLKADRLHGGWQLLYIQRPQWRDGASPWSRCGLRVLLRGTWTSVSVWKESAEKSPFHIHIIPINLTMN